MFQLRIFLSWNDVGSSWWGCEPRDYARSGRWPPLTPSLGSQPHHSAPTSIHSRKIPSWNKIFHDLGYPLSKSLAGKFEVFPSWSIFILSCLKEQENIIYKRCTTEKNLNSTWQDLVVVKNFPVVGGDWYYRGLLALRVWRINSIDIFIVISKQLS